MPPRKVIIWYAVLCMVATLTLGHGSLFFAEGFLLLPMMTLALLSWHVKERYPSNISCTSRSTGSTGCTGSTGSACSTSARRSEVDAERTEASGTSETSETGELGHEKGRLARACALILWAVIACVTLSYAFSVVRNGSESMSDAGPDNDEGPAIGAAASDMSPQSVAAAYILLGIAAMSAFLLTPCGRKLAARLTPIDPCVFRHGVGLSLIVLLAFSWITPLLVRDGVPPAGGAIYLPTDSTHMSGAPEAQGVQGAPGVLGASRIAGMVYQLIWFVPLAFVAAGWPHFRTMSGACVRLGVGRITIRGSTVGIITGLLMTYGAAFLLVPAVRWLWNLARWPLGGPALIGQQFSWAMNPWGALVLAVTAGVGEELLVRGLLQPRFGLILSNLAFAAMHAYGYGWDGLVSVLILGSALGALRARTNTTVAMLAHAVYNFATLLGIPLLR